MRNPIARRVCDCTKQFPPDKYAASAQAEEESILYTFDIGEFEQILLLRRCL
ncbi:MAG: hypothetical protein AAFV25_23060 [Bacteroidota bacterium]